MVSLWMVLSLALAVEPTEPEFVPFLPGNVQVQVGFGLTPPSPGFFWWWRMAEGFYPVSATADVGVLSIGPIGVSAGADAHIANQPLLNTMLRLRAAVPWWLAIFRVPDTTERIASFDWRTLDRTVGGRLSVHANRAPGRPYVLVGIQNTWHRVSIASRSDVSVTAATTRELMSLAVGGGATSLLQSGFLVGIEGRYQRAPSREIPGIWVDPNDGLGEIRVPSYMRAPQSFVLRASVGYRLGGRRKPANMPSEAAGGS